MVPATARSIWAAGRTGGQAGRQADGRAGRQAGTGLGPIKQFVVGYYHPLPGLPESQGLASPAGRPCHSIQGRGRPLAQHSGCTTGAAGSGRGGGEQPRRVSVTPLWVEGGVTGMQGNTTHTRQTPTQQPQHRSRLPTWSSMLIMSTFMSQKASRASRLQMTTCRHSPHPHARHGSGTTPAPS